MLGQVLGNAPRSLPLGFAVAGVRVLAVVWLYPPQVKGLSVGWRWGLPLLRAGGMLALAVALLKPAVMRPKSEEERGAVVVLGDRSRSMAGTGKPRTPAPWGGPAGGAGRAVRGRAGGGARGGGRGGGVGGRGGGVRWDRGAALRARAADVRPLVAAAERAAGDLEYARVAGRGVEAARERAARATQRLRDGAAELARAAEVLGDPAVRERLAGFDVP